MATPEEIAKQVAILVKVYGTRAGVHLGDDTAKELLYGDLLEFSDEEFRLGVNMMRREQESLFADGTSIFAMILRYVRQARTELRNRAHSIDASLKREDADQLAGMTWEQMAVDKYAMRLLCAISKENAEKSARLKSLPLKEAIELVPKQIQESAKRAWRSGQRDHLLARSESYERRLRREQTIRAARQLPPSPRHPALPRGDD